MSKRSRQRPRPGTQPRLPTSRSDEPRNPPSEPKRLLLDQIAAGELDPHLTAIADAIHARREPLHTINSAKALAVLDVGGRVRFNHNTRPQHVRGAEGIVVAVDPRTATVRLQQTVGRFSRSQIRRCPPLLLDRLSPAA
jgi:hypothetical protein